MNGHPLLPGEIRPEFDEEGEPIWYVGEQGIVGPTDEEPVSVELSIPKVELRRIQARHMAEVFSIPGVHGFGIGAQGFVVVLEPEHLKHKSRIPKTLEGVPVGVEVANLPIFISHADLNFRPVVVSAGIQVDFGDGTKPFGTAGPHIVRDENQPGIACCQIWSLTAAHVVQRLLSPPPTPGTRPVYQPSAAFPSNLWGYVAHSWSNTPCDTPTDPNCTSGSAPINWSDQTPDVAAIAHISLSHTDDPNTFVATGNEPIRRMKYGRSPSSYVNGPSGLIRTPGIGTQVKMWGSVTDAGNAVSVTNIDMAIKVGGEGRKFKYCCVDRANLLAGGGDSGSLIAYDGTGNRHVVGVAFAQDVDANGNPVTGTWFTKSFEIQSAFINAGKGFHYYWGTAGNASQSGNWRPARTQCDPPGC